MKKQLVFLILGLILISSVSAADVAYIYRSSSMVDDNVLDVFSGLHLSVDLINEDTLPKDFSNYKFLFIGDESFRNEENIPVDKYPSIITSYSFGKEFGLTDADGVSKLAANSPLQVKKDNQAIQVYTQAKYSLGGIAIPYYFLDDHNKAPQMQSVARTYTGINQENDFGDVISYAGPGADLLNGNELDSKLCFFGIIESDYWTPAARELFEDCAGFVGITCEGDNDCPDDEELDKFCRNDDVYVEVEKYDCKNDGTFNSECVSNTDDELEKNCDYFCYDAECVRCNFDYNCDDGNIRTEDSCVNPKTTQSYCEYGDITCFNDNECDDENNYTKDTCLSPGTVNSECKHENIICFENEDCNDENDYTKDLCRNPGTVQSQCEYQDIGCLNDFDCEDNNERTFDECVNPGTSISECRNTEMNCLNDADCGITGFVGEEFCNHNNVWKTKQIALCHNPATILSSCAIAVYPELIQDCDDGDIYTIDSCVEDGIAHCEHKFLECLIDSDCDEDYYTNWEFSCEQDDVIKTRELHDFFCCFGECSFCQDPCEINQNTCKESITPETEFVANCEYGCDDGECLQGCYEDSDCGEVHYGERYCEGSSSILEEFTPTCTEGECGEELNLITNICLYGCDDGKCNEPECSVAEDCGDVVESLECVGDDLVKTITTPICIEGLCGEETSNETTYCEYGCANDECIEPPIECNANLDCGLNQFLNQEFCQNNDVFDNFIVYSCVNPGQVNSYCEEAINPQLIEDCGDDSNGEWGNYCKGDDVWRTRDNIDKGCVSGECFSETVVEDEFLVACEYGCDNGSCIEGTHDVALVDFTNSVNGIGIQDLGGNYILGNTATLNCNQEYKIWIDVENKGDFGEAVEFESFVDGLLFNHLQVDNLLPQENKLKYRTVNFSLEEGAYTISVEAIINSDDNLENNLVQRNIEIVCEEPPIVCERDSDCGTNQWIGDALCSNNDVNQNFKVFTCLNPGTINSQCVDQVDLILKNDCGDDSNGEWENYCKADDVWRTRDNIDKGCVSGDCYSEESTQDEFLVACEYGCANDECIEPPIECNANLDCGLNQFLNQEFCQNNDVFDNFIVYSCVNPGQVNSYCEEAINPELIEDCGDDSFGNTYCIGKDIYQNQTVVSCADANCFSEINPVLVGSCDYRCANGGCIACV